MQVGGLGCVWGLRASENWVMLISCVDLFCCFNYSCRSVFNPLTSAYRKTAEAGVI